MILPRYLIDPLIIIRFDAPYGNLMSFSTTKSSKRAFTSASLSGKKIRYRSVSKQHSNYYLP